MAELHLPPRDPVKTVPQNYPKPKCDPKKNLIHLPPAAVNPTMEQELGHRFRSPVPPSVRPRPSSVSSSDEEDETKSQTSDRSASHSPPLPFARPTPTPHTSLPGSVQTTSSLPCARAQYGCAAAAGRAAAYSPAARNKGFPPSKPYLHPSQSVPPATPASVTAGGTGPYPQRGFPSTSHTSSQLNRGPTIPRHSLQNGICSPAANMGRGNPYTMN